MVKRCCYGTCKTDSRYQERMLGNIDFHPFPKPASSLEKCLKWIKLCGRLPHQINEEILRDHSRAKHFYVCSKHFKDGRPTLANPDPLPSLPVSLTEPPKKKRRLIAVSENDNEDRSDLQMPSLAEDAENNQNIANLPEVDILHAIENISGTSSSGTSSSSALNEPPVQPFPDYRLPHKQAGPGTDAALNTDTETTMLEMLALASENDALRQHLAKLILENENLLRKTKPSPKPTKGEKHTSKLNFSASFLRQNQKKDEFVYYTGLTQDQFQSFYDFLVPPRVQALPFNMTKKMSCQNNMTIEDQLLLVMIKLRQNFDFVHIGKLFGISQQDSSTLFSNWINYMFFRCSSVKMWPHRDTIIRMMPQNYRKEFPNTLVIIDGTEIKIQRPSSLTRQSQCYSEYKSCNTVKGLVGIDPRGGVVFASMLFTGSISDTELTEKSGFLTTLINLKAEGKIQAGDGIMVDKGFRIEDQIKEIGLQLNIPPFAHSGIQMSSSDISKTEKIARHRVHVERAIARIKSYKILSNQFDLSLFSCINQIWFVCCFATNFMNFLIK